MINMIDAILNKITMYRVVLYHLFFLLLVGLVLSALGLLSFSPFALVFSVTYLITICYLTNTLFSYVFEAPTNVESVYITALILALIITPSFTVESLALLTWAAILSMASKYIIAIQKKHIFNPAAIAVTITGLALYQSATWWVGTAWMLPFVALGGILILRKQRQISVALLMIATAAITIMAIAYSNGLLSLLTVNKIILDSPLIFFATVMFTEPLSMPPTKLLQLVYGVIVGILFAPQLHIGSIFSTPELALSAGNIFSYIVSPKIRRVLTLKEKIKISPDIYDFIFTADKPFTFKAGQFMEWTLPHTPSDTRGNRRYFTLASAPSEADVRLGVKFYPKASTFKQALQAMKPGDSLVAAEVAGDFTLPKNKSTPCVLIAGGIGVTPFRSMIQDLLDKNEKRPIFIFYAAKTVDDFVYSDIFDKAREQLNITTVYVPSDLQSLPASWDGEKGIITPEIIAKYVPDYPRAHFYISGPRAMTTAFQKMLKKLRVPKRQIRTDFFPGFV